MPFTGVERSDGDDLPAAVLAQGRSADPALVELALNDCAGRALTLEADRVRLVRELVEPLDGTPLDATSGGTHELRGQLVAVGRELRELRRLMASLRAQLEALDH